MKAKYKHWCDRCMDYCHHQRSTRQRGDIQELWETITHHNNSKESFCYGKVNTKTNQIIEMHLLSGTVPTNKPMIRETIEQEAQQ